MEEKLKVLGTSYDGKDSESDSDDDDKAIKLNAVIESRGDG